VGKPIDLLAEYDRIFHKLSVPPQTVWKIYCHLLHRYPILFT